MGVPQVFEFLRSLSSPWLDRLIRLITDVGSSSFYMAAVPVVYWCIDKALGLGLGISLAVSTVFNVTLKDIFRIPRPYVVWPQLGAPQFLLSTGTGWSFPSGHAQGSASFWTYMAAYLESRRLAWIGALIVVIVSFTRIYATVHYPADVFTGMVLGVMIALAYRAVETHATRDRGQIQCSARIINPVLVIAATAAPTLALAMSTIVDGLANDIADLLGFVLGAAVGRHLERVLIRFNERAPLWVQLLKIIMGLAGFAALRFGLKAIFPISPWWTMIRYAVVALWVTAGAPWLFKVLFGAYSRPSPERA